MSKWIQLNQDNLRIGTAKAVARLMSFAQITCILNHGLAALNSWSRFRFRSHHSDLGLDLTLVVLALASFSVLGV